MAYSLLPRSNMKTFKIACMFTGLILISCVSVYSAIIRIPDDYASIQGAINASQSGDVILVSPGTYGGDIIFFGKNITVQSDVDGNGSTYDIAPHNTVIANGRAMFRSGETESAVLDGFTITLVNADDTTVGIEIADSSPTIRNCIVSNSICGDGCGVQVYRGASPKIINSVFYGNSGLVSGAGADIIEQSSAKFINCTFFGNTAPKGAAIHVAGGSYVTLVNTILWGNSATQGNEIALEGDSKLTVSHCDIQGGKAEVFIADTSTLNWENTNINANPLFADIASMDFHLQIASPCINKATAIDPDFPVTDYEGKARIIGDAPDMGAYESPSGLTAIVAGDVDSNNITELKDAIIAFQILAGAKPNVAYYTEAEINNDGRIGLAESIYILRSVAGMTEDADGDGYLAYLDCDDSNLDINPSGIEICGDGIDQNCDGSDQTCDAYISYAEEDFASGSDGFWLDDQLSVSEGQLVFNGDRSDSYYAPVWNGGDNPSGNWYPSEGNSNYFDNFNVSIDTFWRGGSVDNSYGLEICNQKNAQGYADYIGFYLTMDGWYLIGKEKDGSWETIFDWNRTFLRKANGQGNRMSIEKEDNNYRFYLNETEIHRETIDGHTGGGIGLFMSQMVDVGFDNLIITSPQNPSPVGKAFPDVTLAEKNAFVYKVMTSSYLWSDEVPDVNYEAYASPEELLEHLKYKELDRWSYIASKTEYHDFFSEGKYVGVGIGFGYDHSGDIRIRFVYKNSPADLAGLSRGDRILEVNGKTVEEIEADGTWGSAFGSVEIGTSVALKIQHLSGIIQDINIQMASVTINSILHYEAIPSGAMKIGYIVFNQFIETSRADLETAFNYFRQQGINRLILDLRYNSGGRLDIAKYMAEMIGGSHTSGQVLSSSIHNDDYSDWNYTWYFENAFGSFSLHQLVVITTDETCSASEMVMNALGPFISVASVGSSTCGKPVGMYGYDFYDSHISPIEFKGVNANGEGDYFNGISPTCYSIDDLTKPFGDIREDSLNEALNYTESGSCTSRQRIKTPMPLKMLPLKGFRREIGAF